MSSPVGSVLIQGNLVLGTTLYADNAFTDENNINNITYQWTQYVSDVSYNIVTDSSNNYFLLTEDQIGKTVSVIVSYEDDNDIQKSLESSQSSVVVSGIAITGTAKQGFVLDVSNIIVNIDGTTAYQWNSDGTQIDGETGTSITLAETHVGKYINIDASYTDLSGVHHTITSSSVGLVENTNDTPQGTVTIIGNVMENNIITAVSTITDADELGPFYYQWYANSVAIPGATNSYYLLTSSETNKKMTVSINYLDARGTPESVSTYAGLMSSPTGYVSRYVQNWLDGSLNSNLINSIYTQGFIDISGGDLNIRYGGLTVAKDEIVVGNVIVGNNIGIGLTNPSYPLDISGNVYLKSLLVVGGDVSLNNRLFMNSDVSINGFLTANYAATSINASAIIGGANVRFATDCSINQRLFIAGDVSMNAKLFAAGDVSMNTALFVGNDATTNQRLFVGVDAALNQRLFVISDAALNQRLFVGGDASMNQRLFIGGDGSMSQRMLVSGDASMNQRLFIGGDVSMNQRLFIGGDVSLNSRLTALGDASFNSRALIGGDASLNSKLFVKSDASFNANMFVGGDASMNARLFVGGDVEMNKRFFINGDISMNQRLFVGGDVSMNRRLFIRGDISFNGVLTVANDISLNGNLATTNLTMNNAIKMYSGTTYSSTPVDLSNANPISQNIFVSAATTTLTMPTMNPSFAGMNINIRKIGSAINTTLTINAPESATRFVAAGTIGTLVNVLTVPAATSTVSLISDGTDWYQL